jgi:hypothetical protein
MMSSDSMKNFLRAACVAICKVYQTGRKPMRGRHRVLRGGLQGIIAFSRSAFILRFHMCMALYSIFPWRGIAGFGASGRKDCSPPGLRHWAWLTRNRTPRYQRFYILRFSNGVACAANRAPSAAGIPHGRVLALRSSVGRNTRLVGGIALVS